MRLQLSRPASFRFLGVLAADMSADQLQERRGVRITFIENTAASRLQDHHFAQAVNCPEPRLGAGEKQKRTKTEKCTRLIWRCVSACCLVQTWISFSQEAKTIYIYIYMITFTTSAQASFTTMQAPYLYLKASTYPISPASGPAASWMWARQSL